MWHTRIQGTAMSRTILVVDDKDSVRTLLREFLTAQHFRVATATNGRAALLVARQAAPDLVILFTQYSAQY
jgi:DNA-binding response OmpR family regulator